jgi:hypothetical protein
VTYGVQEALRRLRVLEGHLASIPLEASEPGSVCVSAPMAASRADPNDVVIVGAVRTAICKVCDFAGSAWLGCTFVTARA